jgi:hypothetical protein
MPMIELQIGDQTIRYDRDATVAVYKNIEHGWAEKCGCAGCRNFAAQRDLVYPPSFRALLDQLGIDPDKEGEVDEYGPVKDGCHFYDGWFYLIGELLTAGEQYFEPPAAHGFEFFFTYGGPPAPAFRNGPLLAIEFKTHVKWVLPERPEYKTTTGDILKVTESGEVVKVKPER